jgi:hypothetical protein
LIFEAILANEDAIIDSGLEVYLVCDGGSSNIVPATIFDAIICEIHF